MASFYGCGLPRHLQGCTWHTSISIQTSYRRSHIAVTRDESVVAMDRWFTCGTPSHVKHSVLCCECQLVHAHRGCTVRAYTQLVQ